MNRGGIMGNERIEELLLQLLQDMAEVKAKLGNIEEQKLSSRIDLLEAQAREQGRVIQSLERRSTTMETFVRDNINDDNKTQKGIFISAGLAIFGALVSVFINLL